MLVPEWATWEDFRELEAMGLTMYGQMTAGSWIYIGTQGILQGTYETFAACARQAFRRQRCAGRLVLTAGLGGMGGAQPLAVTMNGGVALLRRGRPRAHRAPAADCATSTRSRRSLDEALQLGGATRSAPAQPLSVGAASATRPRSIPSSCGAASRPTS